MLDRFGPRAGRRNVNFPNDELFRRAFLKPCEAIRSNVGLLIFEFSRFYPSDYEHGEQFVTDLDRFFCGLPKGWPYVVELRNKHWLQPEYFACLAKHGGHTRFQLMERHAARKRANDASWQSHES